MKKIYKYSSYKELMESIDPSKPVYLDTETSKLGSDIRLVQVYQDSWEQVLLFDTMETNVDILWQLLQPNHLVLHNGTYDFGCFKKDMQSEFVMPDNWDDTFYLLRLAAPELNTKKGFSLDEGFKWCMGYDPYEMEGLRKKELQKSFERIMVKEVYIEGPAGLRPLTEEQELYASIDVYELPKLYEAVRHKANDFVYELDKLTIRHISSDKKGLPVDVEKLDLLIEKDYKTISSIDKNLPIAFNVNSYLQVRNLLNTVMSSDEEALTMIKHRPGGLSGMWLKATQDNGKWPKALLSGLREKTLKVEKRSFGVSTSITQVSELAETSGKELVYYQETSYTHSDIAIKDATLINDKRKTLKRLNFAERAKKAMKWDEEHQVYRIQGTFSPHAINGRIQVDSENLSQYPRTMKSMWGHKPGNGRKLIYSDFAQVELRIICAALPEMNMYNSLKQGIDLHTYVGNSLPLSAQDLSDLPAGISPRFIAKQCNFLLLYGGGESNFQRTVCKLGGVWFNDELTHKIVVGWKDVFSDIKEWQLKNNKSKTNMDRTVSGRPYKAGTVTDLNNIRVSGTGSEIFKLWLHYVAKYVISQYDDVYLVNRVHDSLILDVPDDEALYKEISYKVAITAQKAWFEIIKNAPLVDVPMPVDVSVGSNWEDIEYGKNLDYNFTLDEMFMYNKELEDEIKK